MEPTDIEAVQAVIAGVAHHIDRKKWSKLRALYDDRVRTDYRSLFGGEIQDVGGDDLIATWRKMLGPVVTQHLLGPVEVEIGEGLATAHCHVRAWHVLTGAPGGPEWMVAGHYVFVLGRAAGTWKIREMTLETFYQTGNRNLLAEAAAVGALRG